MLATAVIRICAWPEAEFSATNLGLRREQVLNRLRNHS
jgi:hypothetical protein